MAYYSAYHRFHDIAQMGKRMNKPLSTEFLNKMNAYLRSNFSNAQTGVIDEEMAGYISAGDGKLTNSSINSRHFSGFLRNG